MYSMIIYIFFKTNTVQLLSLQSNNCMRNKKNYGKFTTESLHLFIGYLPTRWHKVRAKNKLLSWHVVSLYSNVIKRHILLA